MKRLLTTGFLLFSAFAYAGGFAPGVAQGALQGMDAYQQRQMSQAWTNCMNQGGGASCGPAPQQSYQQPAPIQPLPKQTDYMCVSRCSSQGYIYGYCVSRCSW